MEQSISQKYVAWFALLVQLGQYVFFKKQSNIIVLYCYSHFQV